MEVRVVSPEGKAGPWHDGNRIVKLYRWGQELHLPMSQVRSGDVGATSAADKDGIHLMRKVLRLEVSDG